MTFHLLIIFIEHRMIYVWKSVMDILFLKKLYHGGTIKKVKEQIANSLYNNSTHASSYLISIVITINL